MAILLVANGISLSRSGIKKQVLYFFFKPPIWASKPSNDGFSERAARLLYLFKARSKSVLLMGLSR